MNETGGSDQDIITRTNKAKIAKEKTELKGCVPFNQFRSRFRDQKFDFPFYLGRNQSTNLSFQSQRFKSEGGSFRLVS